MCQTKEKQYSVPIGKPANDISGDIKDSVFDVIIEAKALLPIKCLRKDK